MAKQDELSAGLAVWFDSLELASNPFSKSVKGHEGTFRLKSPPNTGMATEQGRSKENPLGLLVQAYHEKVLANLKNPGIHGRRLVAVEGVGRLNSRVDTFKKISHL